MGRIPRKIHHVDRPLFIAGAAATIGIAAYEGAPAPCVVTALVITGAAALIAGIARSLRA